MPRMLHLVLSTTEGPGAGVRKGYSREGRGSPSPFRAGCPHTQTRVRSLLPLSCSSPGENSSKDTGFSHQRWHFYHQHLLKLNS